MNPVSRNGKRHPRRPRIEIVSPTPSGDDAAAIAAAIERFVSETAPAAGPAERTSSPWQRAALLEGVGAKRETTTPWGRSSPSGRE